MLHQCVKVVLPRHRQANHKTHAKALHVQCISGFAQSCPGALIMYGTLLHGRALIIPVRGIESTG